MFPVIAFVIIFGFNNAGVQNVFSSAMSSLTSDGILLGEDQSRHDTLHSRACDSDWCAYRWRAYRMGRWEVYRWAKIRRDDYAV